jgi:hypothetical protein
MDNKYIDCSICFNKKLVFIGCAGCRNSICFNCFKKLNKCPYCRRIYTTTEELLKYIVNIKKYIKNYNKNKSIEKRKRKNKRLKKILSILT